MIYVWFIPLCLFEAQKTAKEQNDMPHSQVLYQRLTYMGSVVLLSTSACSALSRQVQENPE